MAHDYVTHFRVGHRYNGYVGGYLCDHGVRCIIPDLKLARNAAERRSFTRNEKDVILESGGVIEVKSIRQEFTWDPESFPLPQIIVDTADGYYTKKQKPLAYVFVSQPTGAMLAMSTESEKYWWRETKFDRDRGESYEFLWAKKGLLRPMDSLVGYLLTLQEAA